jgi:hypothetical protein
MVLAMDFRRQAQVCSRLAEDCQDQRLPERFRALESGIKSPPIGSRGRDEGRQNHNSRRCKDESEL